MLLDLFHNLYNMEVFRTFFNDRETCNCFMSTLSADNDRNALSFKNSYPTHDFKPFFRGHRNELNGVSINRHFNRLVKLKQ